MIRIKKFSLLLVLLLILSAASAAWAGTDDSTNRENSGSITVWETFFMLLAVIPVSKMMSSIFMKLVARVGTVDEDKWAMIGLGAIGATVGLMKKGGLGNLNSSITKGLSGASPGTSGRSSPGKINMNGSGGDPGQASVNSQSFAQHTKSQGIHQTQYNGTAETAATAAKSPTPSDVGDIPESGQRNLNDIVNMAGESGSKAAGVMAKVGAGSAFAVPEVAPVTAAIYAAAGKAVVGGSSATHQLIKEVKARNKQNNQSWDKSLMQITGTNNRVSAVTKALSATALSPFGSRVSNFGIKAIDKGLEKTRKKSN